MYEGGTGFGSVVFPRVVQGVMELFMTKEKPEVKLKGDPNQ